jgi:hypothetical protein
MYDTFSKTTGDLQRALNVTSSEHLPIGYLLPEALTATRAVSCVSVLLGELRDKICIDKHEFKKSKTGAVCNVPVDSFHEDTQRQESTNFHPSGI